MPAARALTLLCAASLLLTPPALADDRTATGVVFHDANGNGSREAREAGVPGVLVSNGRDVVRTDKDGAYELAIDDDTILFVCKPRDWAVPADPNGLPLHYYIHKPDGSPELEFGGVGPTGALPASVDFPLKKRPERDRFEVILFGDPQPYSIDEVDHFKKDIVPEVIAYARTNRAVALGVTLGDIVGDDLDLYGPHNDVVGAIGLPWLNVHGNHDLDFDAKDDERSDETFNRVFGPTTYAYQYAGVHFIVVDNVRYNGEKPNGEHGSYTAGLSAHQRAFVTNYLLSITDDLDDGPAPRVVMLMHIPAVEFDSFPHDLVDTSALDDAEHARLIRALGLCSLSFAAHWHRHRQYALDTGFGEHQHVVAATTSGSWWRGARDEYGVPHAMMRDGRPNGWHVLRFDPDLKHGYEVRFKAAGRSWDEQLHIHAPEYIVGGDQITEMDLADSRVIEDPQPLPGHARTVTVNLWSGSERATVEVRYTHAQSGESTPWRTMDRERGVDPYWQRLKLLEAAGLAPRTTTLNAETTLFVDEIPGSLRPGSYTIEVRATDMYGRTHEGVRVVRVTG